MRRTRAALRRAAGALAWAAAGCAPAPPPPSTVPAPSPEAAPPAGWHGVVVLAGGDTVPVRFRPEWRMQVDGADTVPAFAGAGAGGGWTAYGRLRGDSLTWGLARMRGDAGTALEMWGAVEPDGSVRGCALPRRGFGGRGAPAAAFALAPLASPAPAAAEAPVERCRAASR